jgi:hypothetical protein
MTPVPTRLAFVAVTIFAIPAGNLSAQVPATVAEAAKAIDLAAFPLMPGSATKAPRRLANLDYNARSDVRGAYAFQKKTLEERGFKELPGGYLSDQSCSGSFGKDGFTISVSTIPASGQDATGIVSVRLANHGNVDVTKLPVPPGSKLLYSFPTATAYVTAKSVKETSAALRALLTAKGWEPYGTAGDSLYFKQNAVKLSVWPSAAPAQGGKTMIQFSTELMSVDLPAPPTYLAVAYADTTQALSIEVDMTAEQLATFYKEALGKAGWKSTTEKPVKIDFRDMMIFRNDAKDIATLMMNKLNGKLHANLDQKTEAEFEEEIRLAKAEEAKRKAKSALYAKMEAEKAAKERVSVAITVPENAKELRRTKDELEFKLAGGEALAAVKTIHADLVKKGWKGKEPAFEPMAGTVALEKKAGSSLVILYVDTGFGDAKVTITTFGADFEEPKAK